MAHKKITVSIPDYVVDDLDYVSNRISTTRSALLSNMLAEPAATLRSLLEDLPENPTDADILRSRGASARLIDARIQKIKDTESDLFSGSLLE